MSDWAAIIGAFATLLTVLGGALRFLWNKVERRFDEIEAQLEACREREASASKINATQLTVIELIWNDLKKLQPKSGTLARAHKLLEDLKSQTNEGSLP
jgi:hypothetical protein